MSPAALLRATTSLQRMSRPVRFRRTRGRHARLGDAEEVRLRGLELEETHARLDAALNSVTHGLMMVDAELSLVMCNRQLRELLNFDPDIVRPGAAMRQVLAHSIAVGNHPGMSLDRLVQDVMRLVKAGHRTSFHQHLPCGRVLAVSWVPVAGGGWVCTYEDITVREAATARAVHLACHDAVTDLPNRRALLDAMQIAWPQPDQYPFSLLCLEIDRFQSICETLGHSTCDMLLQEVADRLGSCVRRGDMVAHLGGACFAVMQVAPASAELAQRLATRLLEALQAPVVDDGRSLMATVSIGIAMPDGAQDGPADVLRNATLAMHRAAAKGGGRAKHYVAAMDRAAQAQHALELDLRAALAARQFELHYQPLVSVADHAVTGFEALVRWRHPVRGMVSPAEFIPLAEQLGLIGPIGEWVLRTACAEAACWPGNVHVAVNLSPEQFTGSATANLATMVADILAETGLPGTRLELEITESVRLQEDAATLDMLHALRGLGSRISLDDFGTGYSSLSYLRCFPFDKIKIDQSFVRGLPAAESMAIVRAVTALGASLGIATVAEGVESPAQLKALVVAGCDQVQGYLFSKPRPACEVPGLIVAAPQHLAA